MLPIRKMLIVADPVACRDAILRAARLVEAVRGEVTLAAVVRELPRHASPLGLGDRQRLDAISELYGRELDQIAAQLRPGTAAVHTRVLRGSPAVEVAQMVLRDRYDLVVKPAPSACTSGVTSASGLRELIGKVSCPVWVINAPPRTSRPVVLAAVDPSDEERKYSMSRRVLEMAAHWADLEGAELHVIHAWKPYHERLLRVWASAGEGELRDSVAASRQIARTRLHRFVSRFMPGLPQHRVHMLKGDPAAVIPPFIARHRVSLLVIGARGRSGVATVLGASRSEKIIEDAQCSVLAVKKKSGNGSQSERSA